MRIPGRKLAAWALLGFGVVGPAHAGDAFATIDGDDIAYEEFERFVYAESRQTFYHGAPLDEQGVIEFRRSAADRLIDQKLMIREATRRGMSPDHEAVDRQLADYESRYAETERWQAEGEEIKAGLRAWLESQNLLEQIDAALRVVPQPGDDQLRDFYERNLDRFTRPEQLRVSIILLRVPPSASSDAWDEAALKAAAITQRIREGASFADEARRHSDDTTAPNGGDMGWVHRGTIGPDLQQAIDELEPGALTAEPVRVLEGMVVARLEGRRPEAVIAFAAAQEQALSLLRRDASEAQFADSIRRLRDASDIQIDWDYVNKVSR